MWSKLLLFLDQIGLLHSGCNIRHKRKFVFRSWQKILCSRGRQCLPTTLLKVTTVNHRHCLDLERVSPPNCRARRSISALGEEESSSEGERGWNSAAMCIGLTMQNGLEEKEATLIRGENTFPGQKHIKTWQCWSRRPL